MMAAHGGYGSESVPLGGGAAVFERLIHHWQNEDFELWSCGAGPDGPSSGSYYKVSTPTEVPSKLSALAYAKFCHRFEEESTNLALALKPDLVLSHDISEGPNIGRLKQEGIEVVTISHVDVVDIFNRLYLGGLFTPELVTRFYRNHSRGPWPGLLRLVFQKQEAVMNHGILNIVPSPGATALLSRCYPSAHSRIETIGWGAPETRFSDQKIVDRAKSLREEHAIPSDHRILLTLSRLSPEKAQDRLLRAVSYAETYGLCPTKLTVVIAGAPAFMQGPSHHRKLLRLAEKLRTRVLFCGHVAGLEKAGWYEMADIFVVNSLHESYGLTTLEAMQRACPVVAVRSFGTEATVTFDCGRLVSPGPALEQRLWGEIALLLCDAGQARLSELAQSAKRRANEETFSKAAERILNLLRDLTRNRST